MGSLYVSIFDLDPENEEYNEIEEDFCPDSFNKYSGASCILYDDGKCDGTEGLKELKNGDVVKNIEDTLGFDVESISIKKGCQLTVYTGKLTMNKVPDD